METAHETLEKIADLGLPKGVDHCAYTRKFKYRVSYQVTVRGIDKAHVAGFSYYDLVSARRCYRDILLAHYKGAKDKWFIALIIWMMEID